MEKQRGIIISHIGGKLEHLAKQTTKKIMEAMSPNVIVVHDDKVHIGDEVYAPIAIAKFREMENFGRRLIPEIPYLKYLIDGEEKHQRTLPSNIDLVKEMRRIKDKKSHLSKWERDEVERQFNQKYRKV